MQKNAIKCDFFRAPFSDLENFPGAPLSNIFLWNLFFMLFDKFLDKIFQDISENQDQVTWDDGTKIFGACSACWRKFPGIFVCLGYQKEFSLLKVWFSWMQATRLQRRCSRNPLPKMPKLSLTLSQKGWHWQKWAGTWAFYTGVLLAHHSRLSLSLNDSENSRNSGIC